MGAGCTNDRVPVIPPFGGHQALNTIPEAFSSGYDDPGLWLDVSPDGLGYCIRDKFLACYGMTNGAAQWERAEPPRAHTFSGSSGAGSGPDAGGSDEGAGDAGGSDDDGAGAVGSSEDADGAAGSDDAGDVGAGSDTDPHDFGEAPADASAHTFTAPPATGPRVDSGASDARGAPGGTPEAPSISTPELDLPSPLAGSLGRVLASGFALVSTRDLPNPFAGVLALLTALGPLATSSPPQPAVAAQALSAGAVCATALSAASEAATPSAAPVPPPPQAVHLVPWA